MGKVGRYIGRGTVGLMVTVVSLLLLCLILIYLPPVQKLIADKVLDSVSQDMEFSVSIGDVRIGFPLDVHVKDVQMKRKADGLKIVELSEVNASVSLLSLLNGSVNADSITLYGLMANTDTLVPAATISGMVGTAKVYDAKWDLGKGHVDVMTATLQHADVDVSLCDSVPEDSVDDEDAVLKILNVGVLSLDDIACNLSLPADSDTIKVGGNMGRSVLSVMLDLEDGKYIVRGLDVDGMSGWFNGFGMTMSVDNCDVELPEMSFRNNTIRARGLKATLNKDMSVVVSDVCYNLNNGDMSADAQVRCDDLNCVAKIFPAEMLNGISIPAGCVFTTDMKLRNEDVIIDGLGLDIPGAATLQLKNVKYNISSSSLSASVVAKVVNGQQLKSMLPKELTQMVNVPDGLTMSADVAMENERFSVKDVLLTANGGEKLRVNNAHFDMKSQAYDVDLDVDRMTLSKFVRLSEKVFFDGHLTAKGRGFDFMSPKTSVDAKLKVNRMAYGPYGLADLSVKINMNGSHVQLNADANDPNLKGSIDYVGKVSQKAAEGTLSLNLDNTDLYGMHLSETPLKFAAETTLTLSTDYRNTLKVEADVECMDLRFGGDCLVMDEFFASVDASTNGTLVQMYSGDMSIDMSSPLNYHALLDGYLNVADAVLNQFQSINIDASTWKAKMPEANLSVYMGRDNPVADLLGIYDVQFSNVEMDVATSSEVGLECNASISDLNVANFQTNQIDVAVKNDTSCLNYDLQVVIPEQSGMKPFSVKLGGFLAKKELQTRLHYYDDKGLEGVDFGLRAQAVDTMLCMDVYPYNPIIGYRQFEVSDTNYVNLHRKNRIFANVDLQSMVDSCQVHIVANPLDTVFQNVHLLVGNLDLTPIVEVLPFASSISGMVNGDVSFNQRWDKTFSIGGELLVDDMKYQDAMLGDIGTVLAYNPMESGGHHVHGMISHNDVQVAELEGEYDETLDAMVQLNSLPLDIVSSFAPEMPIALEGKVGGRLRASGEADKMHLDGFLTTMNTRMISKVYSLNLGIDNDTIFVHDSKINFNQLHITSTGDNPITMTGEVDLSDLNNPLIDINIDGRDVELVNSKRTRQSELYGKVLGDLSVRVKGCTDALDVTGRVTLKNTSDVTYIMTNTALSVGYRLDDIVTFVDFSLPPDTTVVVSRSFFGLDMNLSLIVEDGARMKCYFSADEKSYIDVIGGGTLTMIHKPEGVTQLTGRYTIEKGEMRYSNTVIPLKTFTISKGSYIEFTGDPMNPKLSLTATERVRTSVSNSDKSTRMVTFNTGLRLSNTLKNLGLEFTIEAPEDLNVQQELAGMTAEEKNKLALSMMATGMYVSSSNSNAFNTTNALNNFLQGEINNLAGKAINSTLKMDMNLGMEQTSGQDGSTHTDYSFKFSKRLFSDRLNIVVGGVINTSGSQTGNSKSGTYINDVSVEWRLDKSGTQYVRLFHDTDYNNLIEGELTENGGGIVLRKKVNDWKDLWKLFQIKR